MAKLNDSAGIFTGPTLEAFDQMEFLVARDGDRTYASQVMLRAMREVISGQAVDSGTHGHAIARREPT